MGMAHFAALRSNCVRRGVGAVIVRDKHVLATGYNGPPSGSVHCDVVSCIRVDMHVPSGERHELCRGLHAEQNAIIQAAVHGISIRDSIIYTTTHPCVVCAKMIMNSMIRFTTYTINDVITDVIQCSSSVFFMFFSNSPIMSSEVILNCLVTSLPSSSMSCESSSGYPSA